MTTRRLKVKGPAACPICGQGWESQIRSIVEDNSSGIIRIQIYCENCFTEYEEVYLRVRQEWESPQ